MALTTNTKSEVNSVVNVAIGQVVTDAGAAAVTSFYTGFKPRYVKFVNITDRITDEWYEGMAVAESLHTVAAGTMTDELTNGITVFGGGAVGGTAITQVTDPGLAPTGNFAPSGGIVGNGFSVKAATILASKSFYWIAKG